VGFPDPKVDLSIVLSYEFKMLSDLLDIGRKADPLLPVAIDATGFGPANTSGIKNAQLTWRSGLRERAPLRRRALQGREGERNVAAEAATHKGRLIIR
jgi:hypothetical protein